jgi:hypothetical protein
MINDLILFPIKKKGSCLESSWPRTEVTIFSMETAGPMSGGGGGGVERRFAVLLLPRVVVKGVAETVEVLSKKRENS